MKEKQPSAAFAQFIEQTIKEMAIERGYAPIEIIETASMMSPSQLRELREKAQEKASAKPVSQVITDESDEFNMKRALLFSKRLVLTQQAEQWMSKHGVPHTPFYTITALTALGLINANSR
jgi:hypothetical protein